MGTKKKKEKKLPFEKAMVLSKMKFTNQIEIQENEVVNNAAADEEENVSTNQLENSQINSRPALTTASLKNQLYLPLPESWVFWQPYDASETFFFLYMIFRKILEIFSYFSIQFQKQKNRLF